MKKHLKLKTTIQKLTEALDSNELINYNKQSLLKVNESSLGKILLKEQELLTTTISSINKLLIEDKENAIKLLLHKSEISIELNDQYNLCESLINIAITLIKMNSIKDGYELLSNLYYTVYPNIPDNIENDYLLFMLYIKISCNYLMCSIMINELEESENVFNNTIDFIEGLSNETTRVFIIKMVIYMLFREKTLTNNNNNNNQSNSNSNSNKDIIQDKLYKVLLYENNIEESNEDFNLKFIQIFNQEAMKYINNTKNSKLLISIIDNLYYLLKPIEKHNNDMHNISKRESCISFDTKYIENMLLIYSSKIKMFQHIYNTLYQIELKYISNSDYTTPAFYSNKNSSTYSNTKLKFTPNKRLIITRLIQLTSNYINTNVNVNSNTKTEMINQLSIANDIINNSKTELSSFSLDQHKQIVNSIMKCIHCNFIKSVQNVFIRQRVKKYLTSIKQIKKNVNEHNTSIINEFFKCNCEGIKIGNDIDKINYSSKGIKKHFYKFDDNNCIQIYNNSKTKNAKSVLEVDNNVQKIVFGVNSCNVVEKYKSVCKGNDNKWNILSFIMNDNKSVDWLFKDNKNAKMWYYGLFYMECVEKCQKHKMSSCCCYLLSVCKMKMQFQLGKNGNGNKGENDKENNEISFVKVLLNYNKQFNLNN